MDYTCEVEMAILRHVNAHGPSTFEELFRALSRFTLNQVFFAIDRLSRDERVSLQHPTRFTYLVSVKRVGSHHQPSRSVGSPLSERGC